MARPTKAMQCRQKFLDYFPKGFRDSNYIAWERAHKEEAHKKWDQFLNKKSFKKLLEEQHFNEIAATVVRIESRTNLLFSFEKIAFRDAVRTTAGAEVFAVGLCHFLYGKGSEEDRFREYIDIIGSLPRKQSRILTWPLLTVFPFIAHPEKHVFLKPNVTKAAAEAYGHKFPYSSKVSWPVYENYLEFSAKIANDLKDLEPRDMIDIQSFIWVSGSSDYPLR